MMNKTILVIGTYDTKDDELGFLAEVIQAQGGQVVTMALSDKTSLRRAGWSRSLSV